MTVSYDVTSDLGKVRFLSTDTDVSAPLFQDEELQAMLDLESGDVRLAAAQALDVIASSETLIQKKLSIGRREIATDGPAEAEALRNHAKELRRQVYESDVFDWAEQVLDVASERERIWSQWLRGQV